MLKQRKQQIPKLPLERLGQSAIYVSENDFSEETKRLVKNKDQLSIHQQIEYLDYQRLQLIRSPFYHNISLIQKQLGFVQSKQYLEEIVYKMRQYQKEINQQKNRTILLQGETETLWSVISDFNYQDNLLLFEQYLTEYKTMIQDYIRQEQKLQQEANETLIENQYLLKLLEKSIRETKQLISKCSVQREELPFRSTNDLDQAMKQLQGKISECLQLFK